MSRFSQAELAIGPDEPLPPGQLRLPIAAPAPVLEPQPGGLIARACKECEVTWYGATSDDCWCCGDAGIDGPLRLFVIARG